MNYNETNEKMIAGLHPLLRPLCRAHLAAMESSGHSCVIKEGMRTFDYQARLYAKGRTAPGPKVTNAPAGRSNHNYGCAYDIVPIELLSKPNWQPNSPIWKVVQSTGKAITGLQSLYDLMGWDLPHFQLHIALTVTTANCLKIFRQSGMRGVWAEVTRQYEARFGKQTTPVVTPVATPVATPVTPVATPGVVASAPATAAKEDSAPFLDGVVDEVPGESVKKVGKAAAARVGVKLARPFMFLYAALEAGNVFAWLGVIVALAGAGLLVYLHWSDIKRLFSKLISKGIKGDA